MTATTPAAAATTPNDCTATESASDAGRHVTTLSQIAALDQPAYRPTVPAIPQRHCPVVPRIRAIATRRLAMMTANVATVPMDPMTTAERGRPANTSHTEKPACAITRGHAAARRTADSGLTHATTATAQQLTMITPQMAKKIPGGVIAWPGLVSKVDGGTEIDVTGIASAVSVRRMRARVDMMPM